VWRPWLWLRSTQRYRGRLDCELPPVLVGSLLVLDTSALLTLRDDEDERAGRLAYEQLKARHSLSLADAWITAAAQQVGATLLQEWLG